MQWQDGSRDINLVVIGHDLRMGFIALPIYRALAERGGAGARSRGREDALYLEAMSQDAAR